MLLILSASVVEYYISHCNFKRSALTRRECTYCTARRGKVLDQDKAPGEPDVRRLMMVLLDGRRDYLLLTTLWAAAVPASAVHVLLLVFVSGLLGYRGVGRSAQ